MIILKSTIENRLKLENITAESIQIFTNYIEINTSDDKFKQLKPVLYKLFHEFKTKFNKGKLIFYI